MRRSRKGRAPLHLHAPEEEWAARCSMWPSCLVFALQCEHLCSLQACAQVPLLQDLPGSGGADGAHTHGLPGSSSELLQPSARVWIWFLLAFLCEKMVALILALPDNCQYGLHSLHYIIRLVVINHKKCASFEMQSVQVGQVLAVLCIVFPFHCWWHYFHLGGPRDQNLGQGNLSQRDLNSYPHPRSLWSTNAEQQLRRL